MKLQLMRYLLCPQCRNSKNELNIYAFTTKNPFRGLPEEIKEGLIVPLLKKGGTISIHVYKRCGRIREFTNDYLRGIATKLTPRECYEFCKPFTALGKALSELKVTINVPCDINGLQIKKGEYDLQRFVYYTFFQCFWNSVLNFKENNIINFDWFHPANASRHTEEEISGWFKKIKFRTIRIHETNLSGILAVGVK